MKRAKKLSNSMTRLNTGLDQFCAVLTNISNSDSFDFDKIEENVEKTRHYLAKRIRKCSKSKVGCILPMVISPESRMKYKEW